MQNKRTTILAINPGTRYIGFAVLRGQILADWGVRIVGCQPQQNRILKVRQLVRKLVDECAPDLLVAKRLHPARRTPSLCKVDEEISRLASSLGIHVRRYSIGAMEAFFSPDGRVNKRKLAELVTARYSALRHDLEREEDSLNPYHIRMFEAVAMASVAAGGEHNGQDVCAQPSAEEISPHWCQRL